jgi:hypothetical protein
MANLLLKQPMPQLHSLKPGLSEMFQPEAHSYTPLNYGRLGEPNLLAAYLVQEQWKAARVACLRDADSSNE